LEDPRVAVDVRDGRAGRRRVREGGVVRHQAEVVVVDLDLAEVHGTDGAVRDVDLVGTPRAVVRHGQRVGARRRYAVSAVGRLGVSAHRVSWNGGPREAKSTPCPLAARIVTGPVLSIPGAPPGDPCARTP